MSAVDTAGSIVVRGRPAARPRRWLPVAGAVLAATLLAGVPSAPAVAATAAVRQQCVSSGEEITPVPWSQRLLAPDRAWRLADGAGQRVAVISTGVADHPMLDGAVAARVDLAPDPGSGEPSGEPDCLGVGTGIAGLVTADPVPGIGFHGLSPAARILDAKVVGDRFGSSAEQNTAPAGVLADAVDWAVDNGATVIAVSVLAYDDSEALADAVAAARDAGVVVVASVGEQPRDEEAAGLVAYPAAYDGVIGVGALAQDGTATISRTGDIDLVAPGADLTTTYPGDGLGPASGTAFATGYVAAAAALVRAYRPGLSPAEVEHRLLVTAAPPPEGVGARYGWGIVDPYRAMAERLVGGEPGALPPYQPVELSPEELARRAAQERGDAWAARLALIGLGMAVLVAAAVGFGTRGRRRRWRPGLSPVPADRPEDDAPEPPMELFGERTGSGPVR